jgi:hypothetical protein
MPRRRVGVPAIGRRRPVGRKRVWARTAGVQAGVTGTGTRVLPLSSFITQYGADPIGCTVVRFRAHWQAFTTAQVNIQPTIFVGLGVFQESADLDDVLPQLEFHADWMHWDRVPAAIDRSSATFVINDLVDVRAMRKMEELGDNLMFVFQPDSGDTWTIRWGMSTLLLMP